MAASCLPPFLQMVGVLESQQRRTQHTVLASTLALALLAPVLVYAARLAGL